MPQVTILEGGKPKSFAGVDKLQIALSGGGTSLWVPKDTRLLTALTANVNGTYPPPEGYFGFDTVIVNVPPSQVAGIDPETGQYVLVGTKKTKPEDPKWPTTPNPDDDPYDPDNPDGHGWDPWKEDNPWDKDPYKDDWDEDENELTEQRIPYGIKIVQPPTKTVYSDGETIDYSGIQVQLLDENGNVFTNSDYPDGSIPFSELVFPEASASLSKANKQSEIISTDVDIPLDIPFPFTGGSVTFTDHGWYFMYSTYAVNSAAAKIAFITKYTPHDGEKCWYYVVAASATPFGFGSRTDSEYDGKQPVTDFHDIQGEIVHGKPLYASYSAAGSFTDDWETDCPIAKISQDISWNSLEEIAYAMAYGKERSSGTQTIPVEWKNVDSKILAATFDIHVSPSSGSGDASNPEGGGGGFSGGGGEGTGGEGGGGGF